MNNFFPSSLLFLILFPSLIILGMYGSYLLDKHHWPLVFECVRAMTSTLEKGKMEKCTCTTSSSSRNKLNHSSKKICHCNSLPLFCKIRICEDGIDSYKTTKSFCKGKVRRNFYTWWTFPHFNFHVVIVLSLLFLSSWRSFLLFSSIPFHYITSHHIPLDWIYGISSYHILFNITLHCLTVHIISSYFILSFLICRY